jgi:hypothetical protein
MKFSFAVLWIGLAGFWQKYFVAFGDEFCPGKVSQITKQSCNLKR